MGSGERGNLLKISVEEVKMPEQAICDKCRVEKLLEYAVELGLDQPSLGKVLTEAMLKTCIPLESIPDERLPPFLRWRKENLSGSELFLEGGIVDWQAVYEALAAWIEGCNQDDEG